MILIVSALLGKVSASTNKVILDTRDRITYVQYRFTWQIKFVG